MDAFKAPSNLPQDLLLIQSIVGTVPPAKQQTKPIAKAGEVEQESDIDSSGSDTDSEDEIEAQLVANVEDNGEEPSSYVISDFYLYQLPTCHARREKVASSSSDSDSDSDSDTSSSEEENEPRRKQNVKTEDEEIGLDDEDSGPAATTQSYFHTKNETVEATINVPDIDEVGPDEHLERVGEIMTIFDNVVVVRGDATDLARATDRALDSDTLLVFDDRKVLGYVFETFGPTTQPLYQVKFNSTYPLDPEKVRASRAVFHVPQRSNFVWVRQIAAMRGSDASNMNDEEPAEHELDFSDDEAEAEYKRNMKKKRAGSRASSVAASSRHGTPSPSQMRDQDMGDDYFSGRNPYDEVGPYDADYSFASRPTPIPYDDPYSDEFNGASTSTSAKPSQSETPDRRLSGFGEQRARGGRGGRGRGRGDGEHRNRGRRTGRGGGNWREGSESRSMPTTPISPQNPYQSLSASTNSATASFFPQTQIPPWSYPSQDFMGGGGGMVPQQSFVQPHINPRFASQFGFGGYPFPPDGQQGMNAMPMMNSQPSSNVPQWNNPQLPQWNPSEWTVHDGSQSNEHSDGT
ncbi:hypothetical protein D9758_002207 [Tetrapyrgos nigripes]|uniref:H/ACA ribonucleoprotein complex non-core subunit NAF1 n=1 Tax=Tetrapyrgos nigripes TaxID=182062 RepID=A0A8H5GP49_9AGAR|nr:hypothetical protein D9758_002207 [Tetrapyrgos nigripes]